MFPDGPRRCGLNSDLRERRSAICKHFSCHFVSFFLNLTDLESPAQALVGGSSCLSVEPEPHNLCASKTFESFAL